MKRVLVTGGAGFIGSHVVDALLADGWDVTVLENFDPFYERQTKERNIAAHRSHPHWRLIELDLRHWSSLNEQLPGGYDVIVHLAAKAGVRASIDDPLAYQAVNVSGTHNLLEFARQRDVRQFVFASSSSVYGVNPRVPWREDDAVLRPISPYASTKVSGELLGHVYSHLYGIRFIALRLFTVYGPRQRPDLAIHKFARLMLAGRAVPVYGDGSSRRDYTYVDDVVSGVLRAASYDASAYEIINLGNSRTLTLREMIAGLEQALRTRAILQQLPDQAGDVPQTFAQIDKARSFLGYNPQTSYEVGLERFTTWLRTELAHQS